jgi:hypothetical protein
VPSTRSGSIGPRSTSSEPRRCCGNRRRREALLWLVRPYGCGSPQARAGNHWRFAASGIADLRSLFDAVKVRPALLPGMTCGRTLVQTKPLGQSQYRPGIIAVAAARAVNGLVGLSAIGCPYGAGTNPRIHGDALIGSQAWPRSRERSTGWSGRPYRLVRTGSSPGPGSTRRGKPASRTGTIGFRRWIRSAGSRGNPSSTRLPGGTGHRRRPIDTRRSPHWRPQRRTE